MTSRKTAAFRTLALGLAAGLAALAAVWAAGPKSGGGITVTDDLPAGSTGGAGMSGGTVTAEGGLGQIGASTAAAAGIDVESGFFSKLVYEPQTYSTTSFGTSSLTFTWTDAVVANPAGAEYRIEVSSASDFTGTILSSAAYLPTASPQGLLGNTTYYGRIKTLYMEGDESAYKFDALDTHLTAAYAPSSGAIAGFGSRSARLAWDGSLNAGGDPGAWGPAGQNLPIARQNLALASFGRRLFASGGVNGGVASDVWTAEVQPWGALQAWAATTPLPAPRHSHAMAAWRSVLYVTGGFDGSARSTVWFAPILGDGTVGEWKTTTPLPAARFRHAMDVFEGRLYVAGGDNGVTGQAAVYYADIQPDGSLGAWATASNALPAARSGHALVISSGSIYVAGGVTTGVTAGVLKSDIDAAGAPGAWSAVASLPAARTQGALVAGDGRLFFLGGHDGSNPVGTVSVAPVLADRTLGPWSPLPGLPAAAFSHASARVGERLFSAGGSDGAIPLQSVETALLGGTQYLTERALDAAFTLDLQDQGWRFGTAAEFGALTPNTTYFFRTRGRNGANIETATLVLGSTATLAAPPASALSTFTSVDVASIGVQWSAGLNPAGTEFRVQAATSSDFTTPASLGWAAPTSALFNGLLVNTSYYFRVQARNVNLVQTPYTPLGAIFTLSSAPVSSRITSIRSDGFVLEWSTGNLPLGTRYEAQASTAADFTALAGSSVTLSSMTVFAGLPSAATFYARVRSFNGNSLASAFDATVSTRTSTDTTPPGVSTGTLAFPGASPGAVEARWFAPGNDGAAGDLPTGSAFYVQWSSQPPAGVPWLPAYAQLVVSTGPVKAGSFASAIVTGLPLESTVTLRVWTRDQAGNFSLPSSTFSAFSSPFSYARIDGAGGDVGLSPSIAVDRFGNVHVAFLGAAGDVRYLKRTGAAWGPVEAPDPGVIAREVRVAVDNDGAPQVAYRDAGVPRIKTARRSGSWSASVVETGDFRLGGFALDADGRGLLSYYAAAPTADLKFASFTGVGWSTSTVDSGADVGRISALALEADQLPRLIYADDSGLSLRFLYRDASWNPQVIDGASVRLASAPGVAVNGDGVAWFSYIESGVKKLKAGTILPGGSPSVVAVDDALASGGIALDGGGRAFTVYQGLGGELKYARHNGVSWTTGTIDADGLHGAFASVSLDGSGSVLVAYYDGLRGDLRFAQWTGGALPAAGGNAAGRALAPSELTGSALAGLATSLQWSWTDNATGELGFRLYGGVSSTGPFTLIKGTDTIGAGAGTGQTLSYTESGLTTNTTYYRYIVAVTSGGEVASKLASAYPFDAVDVTSPTFANGEAGGDLIWRSTSAFYRVDFYDTGGSKLSRFEVLASTSPAGAGNVLTGPANVATGIDAAAYTTDWALPTAFFNLLWESATNYITIKVYDGITNSTTLSDAFFVLKDTTPPSFVDGQAGDATIRKVAGTAYDVDARDASSGLAAFQYSASTTPLSGDQQALGWTDIPLTPGTTSYATDWTVAFDQLPSDVTSYVSVRAWDMAGSTATLVDAFYVRKDTSGPTVAISTPSGAYVSAPPFPIAGTAADPSGVGGTELAIQQDPPNGLYWTGAIFSAPSPVYFQGTGQGSWQLSISPSWQDGREYRIAARSTDTLGNFSGVYSTSTFRYDTSTPTVGVENPVPNSVISNLAAISGSAADPGAGVARVELRLRRNTDGLWWDWAAETFAAPVVSTRAAQTTGWTLTPSALLKASLTAGTSYFIAVRAVDAAVPANSGDFFVQGATFTFNDPNPPAAITDLASSSSTVSGRIDLEWSAPGNDGNSGVILSGIFKVMYATYTAVEFSTSAAQVTISTSLVAPGSRHGHTITGLVGGTTYFLRAWTADTAGNWSALSNGTTIEAGPRLYNQLGGHVVKTSSEGITAVFVEAFNDAGTLVASTFTVADGSGTFLIDNIPSGNYKVQATWSANGIASSVWQDGIAMGTGNVDFILEVGYTLATLTGTLGTLAAPMGRLTSAAAGFRVAAAESDFTTSKVELFAGGRRAVEVNVNPTGRWTIPNLLPGKYGVRAFNGISYTEIMDVEVGEGELKDVTFVYNPLPENSVFAFPNPAGRETTFRFETPLLPLEAQVLVFDLGGQLVRELQGSEMIAKGPGLYHAPWDLRNMRGEPVASGVYLFIVKIKGGSPEQTAKVVKKLAVVK
ncbi:MAG: hypothetical protein HY553_22880 [Elusimicrobia bacterium]|nr:hypothetical protein [Elusimicrobiota bacterium]